MAEILQTQADEHPPRKQSANTLLPYQKPVLEELGDLRTITLGISNSVGESGKESTHGDTVIP